MTKRKRSKSKKIEYYVLFGFNKSNIYETGYFSPKKIVKNLENAKVFSNKTRISPKKWLEFINNSSDINLGYKFHLIKLLRHPNDFKIS